MTERQQYNVVSHFPDFELRRYAAHLVAEVEVDASFTDAGNRAFGVLVAFISGRNSSGGKVAMTAPVVQQAASERIAMTSPVIQFGTESGRQQVGFVMPAAYTRETLPTPEDARIRIREVPAELAAARTFTGRWTERIYQDQLVALTRGVAQAGLAITGKPRFARFDPPWTPWFLRHNEVVVPVTDNSSVESQAA
jgi:hypothetical protein